MTAERTAPGNMLSRKEGPIGHLVFNNPARRNAVSPDMWEQAGEILQDFIADEAIRVIVLSGAGGKAFVSGADISRFADERANAEAQERYRARTTEARNLLVNSPKPTIAMIRGYCIGGGVAAALNCDMRIASDNARFGVPAARLGLGYEFEGIRRLVSVVGPSFAKEIFFTARQFSAHEALDMGLIDRVVPDAALDMAVKDTAETIAGNAPMTIEAVKRSVNTGLRDPDDRDIAAVEALVAACNSSEDYVEGRRAFMEKRKPVFVGR